jgi:hypothetical protein
MNLAKNVENNRASTSSLNSKKDLQPQENVFLNFKYIREA